MKVIEIDYACQPCKATGLYVGMAERDGAAVVCHTCNGTGKAHFKFEYDEFTGRKKRAGVEQVYEMNLGIVIGKGKEGQYQLPDFGGMPYGEWLKDKPFKVGMENRAFTCPAWWYQSADYKKKPDWKECVSSGGCFSGCSSFKSKELCWKRWDAEFGGKAKR
jgi:hypothetical protein